MTKYSAYTDIENLTGSTLGQTVLEAIIDQGERDIDSWLAKKDLTGSSGDSHLKSASINMGIYYLLLRYDLDGTKPNQLSIGELTMQSNVDGRMDRCLQNAKDEVDIYIQENGGDGWTKTDADADSSLVRQDHNMSDFNLDQNVIPDYHEKADNYGRQDDVEV